LNSAAKGAPVSYLTSTSTPICLTKRQTPLSWN
jgi:hypothetical protein